MHGQCSPHCYVLDPALQCNVLFVCDPHATLTFTCLDINTVSKKWTIMVLVNREANVVQIQGGRKVAISPPFSHHVARCFLICTSCPFWKCALCSIQYNFLLEKCSRGYRMTMVGLFYYEIKYIFTKIFFCNGLVCYFRYDEIGWICHVTWYVVFTFLSGNGGILKFQLYSAHDKRSHALLQFAVHVYKSMTVCARFCMFL